MITDLYNLIRENLMYSNMAHFGLVFASQNMPRMPKPYVVMNVLNIEIPDHVIYDKDINASGYRNLYSWRRATVELQIYNGIESLSSASTLALSLQSEQSLQSQDKLNCAIGARLFFAYVPEMLNTSQFEGRAIYHFEFFYTESFTEDVGLIETVIIEGKYDGAIAKPDYVSCHESITVSIPFEETDWDDPNLTDWDDHETRWDEVVHYGTIGDIQHA